MLLAMLLLAAPPVQDNPRCVHRASEAAKPGAAGAGTRGQSRTGGAWVTQEDYPRSAMRAHQEGTVFFTLDIDATGCPTRCTITKSSGFSALDDATCPVLLRRARFKPAEDGNGNPIAATWSNKFSWVIG